MSSNERNSPPPADMSRRRGSVTQATLSTLFQRSNTVAGSTTGTAAFATPITTAIGDQRRRLSFSASTGVGLSGTSPTTSFLRRGSLSTNTSEGIDEMAVDDEDMPARSPFQRRMSYAGPSVSSARPQRGAIPISPGLNDQGFNWSDQLRSRAESLTMANRPTWPASASPPRGVAPAAHERAKSVADLPPPPAQAASIRPHRESRKPDAFQERILKGDFYMD